MSRRGVWLASAAAAAAAGGGVCWQIFCMRAAGGRLLEPGSGSLGWEYRILSQNIVMTRPGWPEQARQPRRLKQWSDAGGSAGEHWPAHYCDQRIPATLATKQGDQTFQFNMKQWMANGKFNVSSGQRRKVIVLSFLFACASHKVNGKQYPLIFSYLLALGIKYLLSTKSSWTL